MGLGEERKIIKHLRLESCDSTQNQLKLQEPLETNVLISTLNQFSGKGRHSNEWIKQKYSLSFSFTMKPIDPLSWHSLQTSVLMRKWILQEWNSEIKLKWPNDLVNLKGEKIGGLIHEHTHGVMIIGIGLNVFRDINDHYESLLTTLPQKNEHDLALECAQFQFKYSPLTPKEIKNNFESFCFHQNKQVSITENNQLIEGIFKGLGDWGEALIQTSEGEKKIYNVTLRY